MAPILHLARVSLAAPKIRCRRPEYLFVLSFSPPRLLTLARVLYFLFALACFVVWSASFGRLPVGLCVCVLFCCPGYALVLYANGVRFAQPSLVTSVLFAVVSFVHVCALFHLVASCICFGSSASCSSSSGGALFRVFEARRRAVQKWLSAGLFGAAVFPYLQRASFLSGPAPASRVASGGHHGSQRPALKILESFGGVAA